MSIFNTIFEFIKKLFGSIFGKIIHFEKGPNVSMNIFEMLIYGLVPVLGQFLLRANKLGGSLDQPWLLFPLFLIPPFSFIPVLMAKFGFIKNTNGGNPLDLFSLIPIIFRIILIFVLQHFNINNMIIQTSLIIVSLIVMNLLHANNVPRCKGVSKNIGGQMIKASFDSMAMYAAGILGTFLITFIPFVGEIFQVINGLGGTIGEISHTLVWGVGIVAAYIFVNMFDSTYVSVNEACTGNTNKIRMIVSIIAFVGAIFFQMNGSFIPIP